MQWIFFLLFSASPILLLSLYLSTNSSPLTYFSPLTSWPTYVFPSDSPTAMEQKRKLCPPQRVVNRETDDCSCTPRMLHCGRRHLVDSLVTTIASWFYCVRRKRSLLVAICGETFNPGRGGRRAKNVLWPHNIQSRVFDNKWWSVHTVLGNVYKSSKINDFKGGARESQGLNKN
jgi:hypothetical protein